VLFSVIIPTCNRNELLAKCLDRLAPGVQTITAAEYEAFCKQNYPWVRYTRGPRRGPAANRNNGARLAENEWLVFLDDDCIPDNTLLAEYALIIENKPDCKVLEGVIAAIGRKTAFNQECPVNETGGNLWSCNFCLLKTVFRQTGGFDESFPFAAMEDIDFKTRLEQDYNIQFCSKARVVHPWKTIVSPAQKFKQSFISCSIYLEKWPDQNRYFSTLSQLKKLVHHFIFKLIPNLLRYRFRGTLYVVSYYSFLLQLAVFQGKKGYII
jgi:GT2 family glycosyltransferase